MTNDNKAAIILNDLDSILRRIESLPSHVRYTEAKNLVNDAMIAMTLGRIDLHQQAMQAYSPQISGSSVSVSWVL